MASIALSVLVMCQLFCSVSSLLLPVACGGTSQDDTDEGGIVGDGGAGSKRDVTDGDDTDDRAYTSAEGQEDDGDHTPSPSQSSEHSYFVRVHGHVCKLPCYVGCVHECAAIINIPLSGRCMPCSCHMSSVQSCSLTMSNHTPCECYLCGPLSACISCAFSVYLCSRPLV